MATIGNFRIQNNGTYAGVIQTLTLNVKASLVKEENKSSDKSPDFRVYSGQVEFGAAWIKKNGKGKEYLSVKLDDPSFATPIQANLVQAEGDDGSYLLIWSR